MIRYNLAGHHKLYIADQKYEKPAEDITLSED